VKIQLGEGLGAGGIPEKGRSEAESSIDLIERLMDDQTKMVFVTATMGGGTGTGAAPVVAKVAKNRGLLTIGVVTIPFYFEKKNKIIKALRGVEEMRKNVDALLIINNERICDIYSDSQVTIKESFRRADQILCDATKSISELITVEGDINLDFCDVETTLRGGGGAIMAMGRARGEHRVEKAVIDALDSPLLYGNDIDKAKRILFNIYTSEEHPLFVSEMNEIDAFMDALDPNIDVIWGVSDDNSLGEDAKVTILATGFEDHLEFAQEPSTNIQETSANAQAQYFESLIANLYKPYKKKVWNFERNEAEVVETVRAFTVTVGNDEEPAPVADEPITEEEPLDNVQEPSSNIQTATSATPEAVVVEESSVDETESVGEEVSEAADSDNEKIEQTPVSTPPRQEIGGGSTPPKRPFGFVLRAKKLMERITELTQDPEDTN
jgi:cell division protein FtsZ